MSAALANCQSFHRLFGSKLQMIKRKVRYQQYVEIKRYLYASHLLLKKTSKGYETFRYEVPTKPGEKKDISGTLPSSYSPLFVEAAWYDWWLEEGYFRPKEKNTDGEKFTVCLPPPNVTGTLHLGHALTCSIQDAIVRWNRMRGVETLWVPGSDHAGIATQIVVEKQLWADKKLLRHDLGREEFLKRVWEWKESKGNTIYEQMKKMGASLDWSRTVFTMDEGGIKMKVAVNDYCRIWKHRDKKKIHVLWCHDNIFENVKMSRAVTETFVRLHEEGLIYRGHRLVNWCCHLKSTISDIEVDKVEIDGPTKLYVPGYTKPVTFGEISLFDYQVLDSDEKLTVATTRLETMLGDTAVAVHPDDERYKSLHGRHLRHPFDDRTIPIICDEYVDKSFGTGAVKITPSHDPNDFLLGKKHNLSFINVISDSGDMENVPEVFQGLKRFDARRKVENLLIEKGLFKGRKPHKMVLPVCSRSKDIIEQRLKYQWYVKTEEMAALAVKAVETGELQLIPDYFRKVWNNFLQNPEDWCISRQIWWGHRIPAYKVICKSKVDTEDLWVTARNVEEAYDKAERLVGLEKKHFILQQDEDVLDTWFSSALFPFSVHGWPEQTLDLSKYYPSQLLETGSDILFFWVARMVMMGYKMIGQLPFNKVLLHGILRDSHGRKMSKSLGNVIDPIDVIHGISLENLHKKLETGNLDPKELKKAQKGQRQDFPQGIPECGTDALRFALCSYNFKDAEINVNVIHVKSYRHFCNKIWQGFRYVTAKLGPDFKPSTSLENISPGNQLDRWILSRLTNMVNQCDTNFRSYDLYYITKALHDFWIQDFCDIYLEYTKLVYQSGDEVRIRATGDILYTCVDTYLRALGPFMPFLSEELYQRLHSATGCDSICVTPYPDPKQYLWRDISLEQDVDLVSSICTAILSVKQNNSLQKRPIKVYIKMSTDLAHRLSNLEPLYHAVAKVTNVTMVTDESEVPDNSLSAEVTPSIIIYIHKEESSSDAKQQD